MKFSLELFERSKAIERLERLERLERALRFALVRRFQLEKPAPKLLTAPIPHFSFPKSMPCAGPTQCSY